MKIGLILALAIALPSVLVAVPSASALCISGVICCGAPITNCTTLCDYGCNPQIRNFSETRNADGSETFGFDVCTDDYSCRHEQYTTPVATPPSLTCFTYNPDALTNACIGTTPTPVGIPTETPGVGSQTVYVPVPNTGTHGQTVCIIGTECVTAPVPNGGTTSTPENVPSPTLTGGTLYENVPVPTGYVEVTVLCGLNVPCSATL